MKPGFALSLSFEGISLLQRAAGGWRSVGEISLESDDLAAGLAGLRDKASALGAGALEAGTDSGELRCKVIIPNDQIRYLSVKTGSFNGAARLAMIHQALEGATPYPVADLAFDISVDGATTHVAAVARETLAEAEAFAVEHGFNPLSFVAAPGSNPFLGEPFFGPSAHAATLPDATRVEPDGIAVVVIGPAKLPAPVPEPVPDPEPVPEPEPKPEPPVAGFSSRRKQGADQKSAAAAPAAPATPAPLAEESAPPPISVTAPSLEIPETPAPKHPGTDDVSASDDPEQVPAASGSGGFQSRRNKAAPRQAPKPAPKPAPRVTIPPAPAPILQEPIPAAGPVLTAASRPGDDSPEDETARMTVFGAREDPKVGGKPRHLGLILAAALLIFLAAVAAWASIFLEDGVAGLFRESPDKTELVAVPDTPGIGVKAEVSAGEVLVGEGAASGTPRPIDPDATPEDPQSLAQLPPAHLNMAELPPPRVFTQPVQPAGRDLTDTDTAVLDALRQSEPSGEDAGQSQEQELALAPANQSVNQSANPPGPATTPAPGIWQTAPQGPETPTINGLDDLYVASIDRTDLSQDAVALPSVGSLATDLPPASVASPVAAGTAFDLDPAGLVAATVEGTLNPDGVMVFLGRPSAVPPATPTRFAAPPETFDETTYLAKQRPRLRPNDLEERFERSNLGGLTRTELAGLRPKPRPASIQQEAEQEASPDPAPTAQAVVSSRLPKARPGNFARIVSAAVRPAKRSSSGAAGNSGSRAGSQREQVAAVAPRTVTPKIPSSASVARQATLNNAINLRRVNLIGVYGTPSNRRALVRLPSGRYKKVKVGDTVDGGRVVAIGDSELRYQKSGRNLTLKIPRG